MNFSVLGDLNWLAVIVAAVVYFAIGGLWFAPVAFGKLWQDAIGWTEADAAQATPAKMYIVPAVTCLVATVALAMVSEATTTDTFGEGVVLGLVAGIGLVGSGLFVTGFFDPRKPKPQTWISITAGYHVVGLLVAAVILALWT
ncbi:DUF1761 domain-containing protein [Kribbella sp. NBC_01245]|uniref:DUF1761 domain-containing protein n=1 Tax=Kribbella sp. NBC_01245 TaxID=2903578 RepID=UPI002E2A989A|nr:DUF1761 domain-containing protein [Kribbella sp. NBC_01245]